VFDNVLAQEFTTAEPDQAYVTDITYIWTQEGWLYLAVFIDLFSRRVVGWSMGSRMKAKVVTDALRMAIWQRQPDAGLIVHSAPRLAVRQQNLRATAANQRLYWQHESQRGLLGASTLLRRASSQA
jgi:hypothetical protein